MGWFDEQIKQRIENDDALFTEGFSAIGNAVIGKKYSTTDSARQEAQSAEKYSRISPFDNPAFFRKQYSDTERTSSSLRSDDPPESMPAPSHSATSSAFSPNSLHASRSSMFPLR